MKTQVVEKIESLLVGNEDLEVVDIRLGSTAGKTLVQVLLDKDGGISLEDLTEINRQVSKAMDQWNILPGTYLLEVSSAGLERPLKKLVSFKKFTGHKVKLVLTEPVQDCPKSLTGIIAGVAGNDVLMDYQGKTIEVPFTNIKRANLVFEM